MRGLDAGHAVVDIKRDEYGAGGDLVVRGVGGVDAAQELAGQHVAAHGAAQVVYEG